MRRLPRFPSISFGLALAAGAALALFSTSTSFAQSHAGPTGPIGQRAAKEKVTKVTKSQKSQTVKVKTKTMATRGEKAKAEKAKPEKTAVVRTSAIRRSTGSTRINNRRVETEVERTSAISRAAIGSREQIIHRRDDSTPSISSPPPVSETQVDAFEVLIDIRRQRLRLMKAGKEVKGYAISTSRFGIGDQYHSYKTPVGRFKVDGKIGGNLPMGAVLKGGRFTGEILRPNAPGRDPIVTRMIRLRGMERRNSNAYGRGIFIHGTPDEKRIGKPVSWGCVRMRSTDVIDLYARIGDGTSVTILHPEESAPGQRSWFAAFFAGENGEEKKSEPGT